MRVRRRQTTQGKWVAENTASRGGADNARQVGGRGHSDGAMEDTTQGDWVANDTTRRGGQRT